MSGIDFKSTWGTKVVGGIWNISSRVLLTMGASNGYMGLLFSLLLYVFENSQKKKKKVKKQTEKFKRIRNNYILLNLKDK